MSARTIGMPHSEGKRPQPPPGEVGGAKIPSHIQGTGQEASKNHAILTKGRNASCHHRAGPTRRNFKELLFLRANYVCSENGQKLRMPSVLKLGKNYNVTVE